MFPAQGSAGRDKAIELLDLPPPSEVVVDAAAYQAERQALQADYLTKLRASGQLRHGFDSIDKLENLLNGIKDELFELYRQWAQMREQIGRIEVKSDAMLAKQDNMQAMLEQLVAERAKSQPGATSNEAQSPQALRSALEDIIQTREGQAALVRFQNGEEAEALKDLDRLEASHARSIANLALTAQQRGKLSVQAVIARYERVVELDATVWDWQNLAILYEQAGIVPKMQLAAEKMLALAQAPREKYAAFVRLGLAQNLQGDAAAALLRFQQALEITQALAKADPTSTLANLDVSICLDNVGDIKTAQGDAAGALKAYQQSLTLREGLAKADPSNAQAQRDVSISLDSVGRIKANQGDAAGALKAYQQSLEIREALTLADPTSALAKRDVSVSFDNVGRIKAPQGDAAGAFKVYQQMLEILEALALADPTSARAKRDVSVALGNVGDIKATQGEPASALKAHQQSLEICEALALADPTSAEAKRDLSISLYFAVHTALAQALSSVSARTAASSA